MSTAATQAELGEAVSELVPSCMAMLWNAAHATCTCAAVEDLSTRLAELEQRVSTCTRLSEELRTAAATRTQSTS